MPFPWFYWRVHYITNSRRRIVMVWWITWRSGPRQWLDWSMNWTPRGFIEWKRRWERGSRWKGRRGIIGKGSTSCTTTSKVSNSPGALIWMKHISKNWRIGESKVISRGRVTTWRMWAELTCSGWKKVRGRWYHWRSIVRVIDKVEITDLWRMRGEWSRSTMMIIMMEIRRMWWGGRGRIRWLNGYCYIDVYFRSSTGWK